jgi:type III secretion protein L
MERILKAGTAAAAWPRRRISAERWQAGREAEAILADAAAEVAARRREVAAETEGLRTRALEEGRAAGRAEAQAEAAGLIIRAAAAHDAALRAAEAEVVELGIELARRLLEREVAIDPTTVRSLAGAVLRAARGRRTVGVRVHPAAAGALRAEQGALAAVHGLPALEVVEDAGLAPGDAVVETEAGWVDGRLAVRLDGLRAALLGAA